ncbi:hypothetical protein K4K49_006541 [Colletotrichum sp. SAR 10_70]|nr:hypothetical protein K4K49_006541 [Colletotrichum sp. SAR 10_70]KAI8220664.1 hypothetical protein K4K53_007687 [Colletotrichum sp. SAR 10_77]
MAAPAHARYRYPKKPYHLPYQIKYLKLAIRIFNSDIHDILLSRQEKTMVIDDLSKELTNSEKRGPSGDCHNNRTVSLARKMKKGDKAVVKWQAVQDDSRKRKAPETSSSSAESSGRTASGRQIFVTHGPGQKKRRTERDASTATLQGDVEVIEINSDDEDVKPAIKRPRKDAHHGRQENTDPDANNNIGQINAAEAQYDVERQIVTETSAAEVQKTITELRRTMQFLTNIATSENKIFRKDILHSFTAMIQSNGWDDLVQCASELVIAEGADYRRFLAEELREKLMERLNKLSA